ncbi:GNAT family N-acetyltransferase [Microbacterium sp. W4I20]|uniref:GNAT family N-acetyltransferase n=1 Tax=Microbacterium sp. W4I20 TaxID=3042262 RepID=UPI00277E020C|nr:GNAT family N-acetyltransferase [Microbacterium sp. W4I20]MDQ0727965.1 RimJ/RimL family protein N-acetyltransferase [Microbacterium sp. W4I20]
MSEWLVTTIDEVRLRPLGIGDVASLRKVVADNRAHLTAGGDYGDLVTLDHAGLADRLVRDDTAGFLFGIFEDNRLQGVVSLVPVDPPRYGCGYWLAEEATGRGLATASLRALIDHAHRAVGATEIFAGISHGNVRSEAVLSRAGFAPVEVFSSYTRYRLARKP